MEAETETASIPTPAELGYRMPAEWEPHEATWFSWPRPDGISFPDSYDKVVPTLAAMVHALAAERVNINVCDAEHEALVRSHLAKAGARIEHVTFFQIPVNEPWCRDHGPIFITRAEAPQLAIVDWGYNAWGWKYPPFEDDDAVPIRVAEKLGLPVHTPGMVLEGGSIEVNGAGTLLTTKSCLLNPNRNPDLSQKEIEQRMTDYLGVKQILWLGDGIEGDDTDGHIDDLTRFVDRTTVVTVVEEDENDANHAPLQANLELLRTMDAEDGEPLQVHTLPMPRKISRDGQRLPASYANFYIGNKVVLLPVFRDPHDKWAVAVLQKAFPTRKIVPLDCRELIWGLGAFHCLTQQQPRV
ncbi:MAG TPA: agmatine deiminase family protein [Chthoniobacteraceae bacterium]|jgi:agmatine deiminase|nr:aguA [Chthoniobacter sp.]HEV7867575.1 agmatine deiminase family protein [Chthoniobacteraceae bacterium]